MQHFLIPVCYFPTTVLLVSSKPNDLVHQKSTRIGECCVNTVAEALQRIQSAHCELNLLNQRCLQECIEAQQFSDLTRQIKFTLPEIHAELFNAERFTEISVMVVDNALPEMSGLEFCCAVATPNIKKILLIDGVDEASAQLALQAGIIDRYVKKQDPRQGDLVEEAIFELQGLYFQEMSCEIVRLLMLKLPSCLSDETFAAFFFEFCNKHAIAEYYLVNDSGDFVLLDKDANVYFLVAKTKADVFATTFSDKQRQAIHSYHRHLTELSVAN